jgi:hypothetical protein
MDRSLNSSAVVAPRLKLHVSHYHRAWYCHTITFRRFASARTHYGNIQQAELTSRGVACCKSVSMGRAALDLPSSSPPQVDWNMKSSFFRDSSLEHSSTHDSFTSSIDPGNLHLKSQHPNIAQRSVEELHGHDICAGLDPAEAWSGAFRPSPSTSRSSDEDEKASGAKGNDYELILLVPPLLRRLSLHLPMGPSLLGDFDRTLRQRESSRVELGLSVPTTTATA